MENRRQEEDAFKKPKLGPKEEQISGRSRTKIGVRGPAISYTNAVKASDWLFWLYRKYSSCFLIVVNFNGNIFVFLYTYFEYEFSTQSTLYLRQLLLFNYYILLLSYHNLDGYGTLSNTSIKC